MAAHKREGPSICLIILGIESDTVSGLLADKLDCLCLLLREWDGKKACSRKELESLIGLLNHASKVVRSGRSFLRRMIDLLHAVQPSQRWIRLNGGFRSDLTWRNIFVSEWNGVSFLHPPTHLPQLEIMADASGTWGCGAWHHSAWFQLRWDNRSQALHIAEKELIPIILALAVWGMAWAGHQIVCHCDNQVVVACLKSRTSKSKGVMHLLCCLVYIEARQQCYLKPVYIDTKSNYLADALSRNNLPLFLSKVPGADPYPTQVSLPLLDLLLDPLDLSTLEPSVQHYFLNGLAPSTQRTYQAAMKRFNSFCAQYNVLQPFPLSEELLCSFAADQGLASQTGKSYLSALRSMQISLGLPDPRDQSSLPILKRVQAGIN